MKTLATYIGLVVLLRAIVARPRYYLDPGSGSMIIQILLGGLAGLAVLARMFWHRIGGIFGFGKRADDEASSGAGKDG